VLLTEHDAMKAYLGNDHVVTLRKWRNTNGILVGKTITKLPLGG